MIGFFAHKGSDWGLKGVEKSNAVIFPEFGLIRPKFECFVNTEGSISKKFNETEGTDLPSNDFVHYENKIATLPVLSPPADFPPE